MLKPWLGSVLGFFLRINQLLTVQSLEADLSHPGHQETPELQALIQLFEGHLDHPQTIPIDLNSLSTSSTNLLENVPSTSNPSLSTSLGTYNYSPSSTNNPIFSSSGSLPILHNSFHNFKQTRYISYSHGLLPSHHPSYLASSEECLKAAFKASAFRHENSLFNKYPVVGSNLSLPKSPSSSHTSPLAGEVDLDYLVDPYDVETSQDKFTTQHERTSDSNQTIEHEILSDSDQTIEQEIFSDSDQTIKQKVLSDSEKVPLSVFLAKRRRLTSKLKKEEFSFKKKKTIPLSTQIQLEQPQLERLRNNLKNSPKPIDPLFKKSDAFYVEKLVVSFGFAQPSKLDQVSMKVWVNSFLNHLERLQVWKSFQRALADTQNLKSPFHSLAPKLWSLQIKILKRCGVVYTNDFDMELLNFTKWYFQNLRMGSPNFSRVENQSSSIWCRLWDFYIGFSDACLAPPQWQARHSSNQQNFQLVPESEILTSRAAIHILGSYYKFSNSTKWQVFFKKGDTSFLILLEQLMQEVYEPSEKIGTRFTFPLLNAFPWSQDAKHINVHVIESLAFPQQFTKSRFLESYIIKLSKTPSQEPKLLWDSA
ncbi:hypothetical protein O181_017636 [Austropuccinia psidii MF-1]|uniref:Uncharacterized protein n=1 Tax=Austropuccinia psidii MF-1 TaxID=1389203 RepID=A0A9Q3C7Z6_9BASI|nr:hypothetical protein [Austropuccinia psidii MF-1]